VTSYFLRMAPNSRRPSMAATSTRRRARDHGPGETRDQQYPSSVAPSLSIVSVQIQCVLMSLLETPGIFYAVHVPLTGERQSCATCAPKTPVWRPRTATGATALRRSCATCAHSLGRAYSAPEREGRRPAFRPQNKGKNKWQSMV
jgi:hypothetical protein